MWTTDAAGPSRELTCQPELVREAVVLGDICLSLSFMMREHPELLVGVQATILFGQGKVLRKTTIEF